MPACSEQDTGHKATLAILPGRFYAQIKNGAPFDLLLSADDEAPSQVAKEGRRSMPAALPTPLANWPCEQPGLVDAQRPGLLESSTFDKIVEADSSARHRAAAGSDDPSGCVERLRPKFVQGENIAQTHQFTPPRMPSLVLVAPSRVMSDGRLVEGSVCYVPQRLLPCAGTLCCPGQRGGDRVAAIPRVKAAVIRGFGYEHLRYHTHPRHRRFPCPGP